MSSEYSIRIQKINILHTVYIVHVTHSMSSTMLVCYSKHNQEMLKRFINMFKVFFLVIDSLQLVFFGLFRRVSLPFWMSSLVEELSRLHPCRQ